MTELAKSPQATSEHKRYLVCVLLDCSGSMGESQGEHGAVPINALNSAMPEFLKTDLMKVGPLARHGEIAFGSFFGTNCPVDWQALSDDHDPNQNPFYRISRDARSSSVRLMQPLRAEGQTPMGTAILDGLKYIEQRVGELDDAALPVSVPHRPSLFLITDGRPEGESEERIKEARAELQRAEIDGEVLFWSIATEGADKRLLKTLSVGRRENTFDLSGETMQKVLRLISVTAGSAYAVRAENSGPNAGGGESLADPRAIYRTVREMLASEDDFYALGRTRPYNQ
jgi:uncharacterized protein YegL